LFPDVIIAAGDLICVSHDLTEIEGRVLAIEVMDLPAAVPRQQSEAAEDQAADICADIIHRVVDQRRRKN
jgi:hypothetical protein